MATDPARQIAKSARSFEDPAERAAYLDRVCRGIARLRADVERCLAEMEAEGGAADPAPEDAAPEEVAPAGVAPLPADAVPAAGDESLGNEKAGDRIGRYLLVKELGEGGFGTVWKAEQVEPVKRSVALKIIKLGMDTEQVVVRFEQERQALALMDHPHVARVLDAGATRTGRPYFVMDLVQGVPIGEFCDTEKLSVDARLGLFSQVCAAVQHAHMKGIIHRDLKPSNILVADRDGTPHATVIDFGIAKATSSRLTDRSMVTEAYQVIGTLQYMSPEQSQASPDIDTRTDVYSLGVILYELLTGSTPYDTETFQRAVLSDILRMIGEVDPPPPSARITETRAALPALAESRSVDTRRLAKELRGDLDWIVLKAIEKDRGRRYESAEALAADIRRHLAGEAVTAAPPSASYRMRKFVRRNKGKVAAAAAVAASLLTGVVAFAWQAGVARDERDDAIAARRVAEEERRIAETERKRSESVAALMETVFEGINPDEEKGGAAPLKDQIVAKLDSVAGEFSRLEGDPVGRARLQMALAGPLYGLAEYEKALAAMQDAYRLRAEALGPAHPQTAEAALSVASVLRHLSRHEASLREAEAVRSRALAAGPLTDEQANEIDHSIALTHQESGRHDLAIPYLEAVRDRHERAGGPDTRGRLNALQALGAVYRGSNRIADAIRVLTDTLARRTALLGADHADTVFTANSLAVAYASAGRMDEALKIQEDVCQKMDRRYAADHPDAMSARANLALFLVSAGREDEAVALMKDQGRRAVARYGAGTAIAIHQQYSLAHLYARTGKSAEAANTFEEILPPMTRIWGADHGVVSAGWRDFAAACLRLGDAPRALRAIDTEAARLAEDTSLGGPDGKAALRLRVEALRLRLDLGEPVAEQLVAIVPRLERVHGPSSRLTLETLHQVGRAYFAPETAKAAVEWFERALAGRTAAFGADDPDTIETQHSLGAACWLAGDPARARGILGDTLTRAERVLGKDSPRTLTTALDLAVNHMESGRPEDYRDVLATWLPRAVRQLGTQHDHTATSVQAFIAHCNMVDRLDLAAETLQAVYEVEAARLGPDDPEVLRVGGNAAACWFKASRLDKSLPMFEDLVPRMRRVHGPDDDSTLMACANLGVNLREAGRLDEAITVLGEVMAKVRAGMPSAAGVRAFASHEYLRALVAVGHTEDARTLLDELVAEARRKNAAGSAALATELAGLAGAVVNAKLHTASEAILREVVAIREKVAKNHWTLQNSRALLGEALLGQGRFAEAEPLVTGGCRGLLEREATMPSGSRSWVVQAKDRVLRFYAAWDAAEPGRGHDAKLAEWKKEFATTTEPGK